MSYTHRKNSIKIILDRNSFFKVIIKTLNDRKIRLIYKSDFKIFASPLGLASVAETNMSFVFILSI